MLTGLRSALWVPVGNTAFSAVKLALLVAFAVALPTTGVFVSWVAAIAVSVLPLGWLVFRRLVPRHVAETEGRRPPTLRETVRFLAGDYTGSLFSLAVVYLVPVIIASQVSSEDNAYFYITTTIGGTCNLLAINMGGLPHRGGLARPGPARRRHAGRAEADGADHAAGGGHAVRGRALDPRCVRAGLRRRGHPCCCAGSRSARCCGW
ncbi:hypothetical protein GCM10020256_62300 [Streptomyces thermocoprophilus]